MCITEQRFGLDSTIRIELANPGDGASFTGERGDVAWGSGGAIGDEDGDGKPNWRDPDVAARLSRALARLASELEWEAVDEETR